MSERSRERIRFRWNSLSLWLDAGTHTEREREREVSGDGRLTTGLPLSHIDKYGLKVRTVGSLALERENECPRSALSFSSVWPLFSRHFPLDDESFNGRAYFRIDPHPRRTHHHHELPPTLSSSASSLAFGFARPS